MSKFIIEGGSKLEGEIRVAGNKNAVLPLMAASVLTDRDIILHNVPDINDVKAMGDILRDLGASVSRQDRTLIINCSGISKSSINAAFTTRLRASVLFIGPLLARAGNITISHPGGDLIGKRGIESHLEAMKALGADIQTNDKNYRITIKQRKSGTVFLDQPTVTGTENLIMYAALSDGQITIENAASEPHIVSLANMLNKMGAKIRGAGTSSISVLGKKKLSGAKHSVDPDFIEAGTFAITAALTKGNINISPVNENDIKSTALALRKFGIDLEIKENIMRINANNLSAPARSIQATPWPGFPTDLMSPLIVLASQAAGQTLCHDPMYESRMFFVDKLISMGAKITICDPHRVIVSGPTKLYGRRLVSPDIRAGMALVVAALIAEGESIIEDAEIIGRGYERIEERLSQLGANIKKI